MYGAIEHYTGIDISGMDEDALRSTAKELHVEVCSSCHPFYTGKQKILDSAGQIDKFRKRYSRG